MDLTELAKTIRFDNASKGFDPLEGGINRYLLLVCSEVCEALEELRDGHEVDEIYYSRIVTDTNPIAKTVDVSIKPEGFPVEIADAAIRILDIQSKLELKSLLIPGHYNFKDLDNELLGVVYAIGKIAVSPNPIATYLQIALTSLFHIANHCKFDMLTTIELKLAYNRTRPPKHGRKF